MYAMNCRYENEGGVGSDELKTFKDPNFFNFLSGIMSSGNTRQALFLQNFNYILGLAISLASPLKSTWQK